jgi:hypothetical protein
MIAYYWMELDVNTSWVSELSDELKRAENIGDSGRANDLAAELARAEAQRERLLTNLTAELSEGCAAA